MARFALTTALHLESGGHEAVCCADEREGRRVTTTMRGFVSFGLMGTVLLACGIGEIGAGSGSPAVNSGTNPSGSSGSSGSGAGSEVKTTGSGGGAGNDVAPSSEAMVHLVPASGVSGSQHVNVAVPFGRGWLTDATHVRVSQAGKVLPIARRVLAKHSDGSVRSVQLQFDLQVTGESDVAVQVTADVNDASLTMTSVQQLLAVSGQTESPKVWTRLPSEWLAASGVGGPLLAKSATPSQYVAWDELCDYDKISYDSFVSQSKDSAVWLYDRPTTLYRGYFRHGDQTTLADAYKEVSMYRAGLHGTGTSTTIGLTDKADDLKYYYSQGFALHYLLTGDDRYREAAENIAERATTLYTRTVYNGSGFWTERNSAFALLAYVWASIVSDDKADRYATLADAVVSGLAETQNKTISGYTDTQARCYSHSADSHGEDYGYDGCSPWMSAIVADGLETYMHERPTAQADVAKTTLIKLGRFFAKYRDADGKPYYWVASNGSKGEVDPDDEHWGEGAYLVSLAYYYSGKTDTSLAKALGELTTGLQKNGSAPHIRSFNWQCRSAVATSYFAR